MVLEELRGPAVVMLDDLEHEIRSLKNVLRSREIDCKFIKLDISGDNPEIRTIPNLKLIFLDLHYGTTFDAELCAQFIHNIVPEEKQYYLVIWTKDPEKAEEVLRLLKQYNISPVNFLVKEKIRYRTGENTYDAEKLLIEIEKEFENTIDIERFYGQVIELEEDHVLINCLIEEEDSVFQIRRFDLELFENYIELRKESFVSIVITTKPGSRTYEFFNETAELEKKFSRPDYFTELGDVSFLDEPNEDNIQRRWPGRFYYP